jgi:hypothetical protein
MVDGQWLVVDFENENQLICYFPYNTIQTFQIFFLGVFVFKELSSL